MKNSYFNKDCWGRKLQAVNLKICFYVKGNKIKMNDNVYTDF